MSKKSTTPKKPKDSVPEAEKVHPWRRCAKGAHLVNEHTVHYKPCAKFPDGLDCIRHTHCAKNPSGKDVLNFSEIEFITKAYFNNLKHLPKKAKGKLLAEFKTEADRYDHLIGGWTQYWNEVFKPIDPLDPTLIKILIATESSFNEDDPKTRGKAHGLTQIINQTWEALKNHNGELKDHLISVEKKELLDPSVNICACVRWLFHKKKLAVNRLRKQPGWVTREATWIEGIAEYKSYLGNMLSGKEPNPTGMGRLAHFYDEYKHE